MKILHIDLETAPMTAYVWGLFKETVPIQRLIDSGRVMCFAAKWHGDRDVIFKAEWKGGHKRMVESAHKLMEQADAVVHYNGNKFDVPTINKEFISYGLVPPRPYKSVDLYRVVRRNFRFPSNKLDYVAQHLGLGKKTSHEGFELWVKCMAGQATARKKMETYNKQDVRLLEKLYSTLRPWIHNHPNYNLYNDGERPACTACGSTHLQSRGTAKTKTLWYPQYQCQSCGTWVRDRKNGVPPEKRQAILTEVAR